MRIAVTGGGGFIGAATVKYAREHGHEAWAFDRASGDDILGSLEGLAGADSVIHLAGLLGTSELFDNPEEAVEANVIGTIRILEWCAKNGAGYVGISMPDSDWANVYQATKLCSNRLATAWHRDKGVPVSHVRAFNAYGPGQKHGPGHPMKIIPTFATKAWAGEPLVVWGSGHQTVDLVHSEDIGRMLVEACYFGEDEFFDAGTGHAVTVNQVASFVNRIAGNTGGIDHQPMRPGETEDTRIIALGDGWDLLGWRPQLTWDRLRETVLWYKPEIV